MPVTRTQGKIIPVRSYYPTRTRNLLGAPAHRVKLSTRAPDPSTEIALLDATDNVKPQINLEIQNAPRKDFLDILVGGNVVVVNEKVKRHDNVSLESFIFRVVFISPFAVVFRLPEWGASHSV